MNIIKDLIQKINKSKTIKAGFWYTIGNFLLKGMSFFTIPLFTRLLDTSDYGFYNTYMAYESIISVVIGLGLSGTVKNAKYEFKDKFNEYLSSIIFLSFIVFLFFLTFGNVLFNNIANFFEFDRLVLNILILSSYGNFLIGFIGSKYIIEFEYKKFLGISFFNSLSSILISLILILYVLESNKYMARILGHAAPTIFLGMIIFLNLKSKRSNNKKIYIFGLTMGLPLVVHVLSHNVLSQFDRLMIQKYIGASQAGIYSFTYNISVILSVILSSMDSVYTPWFYSMMSQKNYTNIREKSNYYCLGFSILTIGLISVSPEIIRVLSPKPYWDGIKLVVPLILSVFFTFLYYFPVCIEYFYKKTIYIAIGTAMAAIANIILNLIYIPQYGYIAAAYTTLISYILLFIFHWIISIKIKNGLFDIKFMSFIVGGTCLLSLFIYKIREFVFLRYALIFIIGLIVIINNKKIFRILKEIKNK